AAAFVAADRRLGQLGEAERQVLVGLRVVGRPAAAVALRVAAVHRAAILERAVVRGVVLQAHAEPPAAELRRGGSGDQRGENRQRRHDGARGWGRQERRPPCGAAHRSDSSACRLSVDAPPAATRKVTTAEPTPIWSPSSSGHGAVMRAPRTYVPFLLSRSSRIARPPAITIRA